jgi:hypothetical protein
MTDKRNGTGLRSKRRKVSEPGSAISGEVAAFFENLSPALPVATDFHTCEGSAASLFALVAGSKIGIGLLVKFSN